MTATRAKCIFERLRGPSFWTGDRGDRGDTEENCSGEGRHAGVTGETAIMLADMPVTPCLPLCHPSRLGFPFVSPLSPLSPPEKGDVR